MKRKVSLKWYILKLSQTKSNKTNSNHTSLSMSTLSDAYSNDINVINNNIRKELQDSQKDKDKNKDIRNKLVTKLGKLNVSKINLDRTDHENNQNNQNNQNEQQESLRDKSTEYYYKHREEKLEYQKNYNRQKGDAIKDYNKNYYMKRREEILEKARTKVTCECGCVVQLFNMNSHKKTKKHVRYLEMREAISKAVEVTTNTTE